MFTYRKSEPAVTLLELMIVIVIIGIIAGFALPQFQNIVENAKIREAKSALRIIRGAEKIYKAKSITGTYVGVHIDSGTHPPFDNCPQTGGPCTKDDAWDILNIGIDDTNDWSYGANMRTPFDCNAPDGLWGVGDDNVTVVPWARRERGPNAGDVLHIQMTNGDFVPATGLAINVGVGLDCNQQR